MQWPVLIDVSGSEPNAVPCCMQIRAFALCSSMHLFAAASVCVLFSSSHLSSGCELAILVVSDYMANLLVLST